THARERSANRFIALNLTRPFIAYQIILGRRLISQAKADTAPRDLLSACKIMNCFRRWHRRRKVATGREYRLFGILFVCVTILPVTLVSQPKPALIARKQLYRLLRFTPTMWSSVAPQTGKPSAFR